MAAGSALLPLPLPLTPLPWGLRASSRDPNLLLVGKVREKYEWITQNGMEQWDSGILHRKFWEMFTVMCLKLGQNGANTLLKVES